MFSFKKLRVLILSYYVMFIFTVIQSYYIRIYFVALHRKCIHQTKILWYAFSLLDLSMGTVDDSGRSESEQNL